MRIVVPRETAPGERRVAMVPESIPALLKAGVELVMEAGAGEAAGFADAGYEKAGASLVPGGAALYQGADLVLKVQRPLPEDGAADGAHEADRIPQGAALVGFLNPLGDPALIRRLAERRVTAFAMELIPRITRAQRMDALSSQSTVAGYRAALLGATALGRFFPMLMTAAGTAAPARVLVLGAGVAGLQAIATARRLGAVVQGFDIRPAVKEQVESLGATFVGMAVEEVETAGGYAQEVGEDVKRREHELLHRLVADADVVICTALVPGRPAPELVTEEMVRAMRRGSVIVDLAAEAGGNCTLTEPGGEVERHHVRILGPLNAPSAVPFHASQMYARNVTALLLHLVSDGELRVDLGDEITRSCCVTHEGAILHEGARERVEAAASG